MSCCSRPGENSSSSSGASTPAAEASKPPASASATPAGAPSPAGSTSSAGASPSSGAPAAPPAASSSSDVSGEPHCEGGLTVTSKALFKSPADRARKRIGVGEKVELTVSKGTAEWKIASGGGKLSPDRGKQAKVTFTAGDTGEDVVIEADDGEGCSAKITLTVVEPSGWTMRKKNGSNLEHSHGRPDCGWLGIMYFHPDDVNFGNMKTREMDSSFHGNGSYSSFTGDKHGNYPGPDHASAWFPVVSHSETRGSTDNVPDHVYTGDPGPAQTGNSPPFTAGSGYFPITLQWKVGSGSPQNFKVTRQEAEIFTSGKCESRKGKHTERTMHNDPTSTP